MGVWERRDGERIMENGRPQREMAVVESGEGATARQNRPNPPARPAGNSSQTAEGNWASQHDRRVKRAPCRNEPSAEAWACGEGAMRCGILEVNLRCLLGRRRA